MSVRAVLPAPVAAFLFAPVLAAMAGIFIALFGASLSEGNGDATVVFDIIFFPTIVWLPRLLGNGCSFARLRSIRSSPTDISEPAL